MKRAAGFNINRTLRKKYYNAMEPDWQTKLTTMQDRCCQLLKAKCFTDCCFLVGPDKSRQSCIEAHKAMLAVASPVFERMFYGSIPQQAERICVTDIDPEIFNAMLGSIYMDDFHVKSVEVASDLFYAAQKYMLPHLQQKCLAFIKKAIDEKNACRIYEFAKMFDLTALQECSMNFIKAQTLRVMNEPSFMEISVSTFADILDQDSLAINSELDLFNSLLKYAKHNGIYQAEYEAATATATATNDQTKDVADEMKKDATEEQATTSRNACVDNKLLIITKKVSPSDESLQNDHEENDHEPCASRLSEIQNLMKKLRLLTLQPREFSEIAEHEKLIPTDVALAVFIHIPNVKLKKTYSILNDYNCNRKSRCVINANCDFPVLEVRTKNGHFFNGQFNSAKMPPTFNFGNNNDDRNTVGLFGRYTARN